MHGLLVSISIRALSERWLIVSISILYWDGSVETLNVVSKLKTVLLLGVYSVYSALKIDLTLVRGREVPKMGCLGLSARCLGGGPGTPPAYDPED